MTPTTPTRLSLANGSLAPTAEGDYVSHAEHAAYALAQLQQLQASQDALAAARAEVARMHSLIGRAKEAALAESPSWGHRIARMCAALGLDIGGVERINYALAAEVLGPTAADDHPAHDTSDSAGELEVSRPEFCSYCGQAIASTSPVGSASAPHQSN